MSRYDFGEGIPMITIIASVRLIINCVPRNNNNNYCNRNHNNILTVIVHDVFR